MTNWRDIGDVPEEVYRAEFARMVSPMHPYARNVWEAARPHSALILAKMFVEQKYATWNSVIPTHYFNPCSLAKPKGTPADGVNRWERYGSWAEGVAACRERITSPTYKDGVYANTVTVADLIRVFAPPSENDTDLYIDTVNALLQKWPRIAQEIPPVATMQTITLAGLGAVQIPADIAFRQEIIPAGQTNQRPGILLAGGRADRYTQHETGNTASGAGAAMHSRYLHNGAGGQQLSYHLTVDDKLIVQMLPLNEVGWHAGDGAGAGNMDSIACELCVNADANKAKARSNAEWLAAAVTGGLGIPTSAIVQHNYWSGKNCPMQIRADGYWPTYLANVARNRGGAAPGPATGFPEGMDADIAKLLFGQVVKGQKVYRFDGKGSVSKLWLATGAKTGVYPTLVNVDTFGERTYFRFANGLTLWRPNDKEPVRLLAA